MANVIAYGSAWAISCVAVNKKMYSNEVKVNEIFYTPARPSSNVVNMGCFIFIFSCFAVLYHN